MQDGSHPALSETITGGKDCSAWFDRLTTMFYPLTTFNLIQSLSKDGVAIQRNEQITGVQ
jgi:hypothetical protein